MAVWRQGWTMDEMAKVSEHVDAYLESSLLGADEDLVRTLAVSAEAGLPTIAVSPLQGKFLHLLVRAVGARRVLEIGTLGGYSTTWLARAVPPDGRVVSLEVSPHHADVARANLARSGLAERVEVKVGPALSTLAALVTAATEPFDVVFIDADKENNGNYLLAALPLTRLGTLVVVDNIVRSGALADAKSRDPAVTGSRHAVEVLGSDPRFAATALQTVGTKGYDGFALAIVTQP